MRAVELARPRLGVVVTGMPRNSGDQADGALQIEKAADSVLERERTNGEVLLITGALVSVPPAPSSFLRYAQALAPSGSGAAVTAGILRLSQYWMPAVAVHAHSILVVSALLGAIVCAAAPEQRRALRQLHAHRLPAHGARS